MTNALGFLKRIHFVGIGGIGMSGIAEVLHNMEFIITGSDISENANVERLRGLGIPVYVGHSADNISSVDVLVYSSAVKDDNPELLKARENYIPVIPRAEMLAELMRMKYAVAVAGSHGKTTTTSMISDILSYAGYDPTTIIGGRLNSINNNARMGARNVMVVEADESDRSFLMLYPSLAVITNIDIEHMDTYRDLEDVKNSFIEFANRVPFYGCNIICLDDDKAADIIPYIEKRFITYGTSAQSDVKASSIVKNGFSVSYDVEYDGIHQGRINVNMPGDHIVLNSLGAVAAALEMKVPFNMIAEALAEFKGVQRRMTVRFNNGSTLVVDDYGHHPAEIAVTLAAVKEAMPDHRVCMIFQPHRYSRTKSLMNEFAKCFFNADYLYITDIYAASEKPLEGVDAKSLVSAVKKRGFKNVEYIKESDIYSKLDINGIDNTVIITSGAGSITRLSHELADFFNKGLNNEG